MPISNAHWTIFAALLFGYVGFLSTPSMATSLNQILRDSLTNSIALSAARQNWIATREAIGTSTITSDLSARLTSTSLLGETNANIGGGFRKTRSFTTGVKLSKNLYDGGQTKEKERLGQITLQIASANYTKVEQSVILETIEAHQNVLTARREIKLIGKNLSRLEAHVSAAKIRVSAGAITPTRLAEANARYARAQSDLILSQTKLANAEDNFHSLTVQDLHNFIRPNPIKDLPPNLLKAQMIAQSGHPDVLSVIAAERAANQAFNTLQASVRPTLAFSLLANTTHANSSTLDKDEVAAQIVFSSPLLSTNATRSKARNVSAAYEEAKLNRAEVIRKVQVGARRAFRNWKTTATRLDAVLIEIEAFRLVAKGIASEAQFGQKTTLDLLDAEKDLNDASLSLITAEHNQILAAFQLKKAIGELTAEKLSLGDVNGQLADLSPPENPFYDTFPFRRKPITD